MIANNISVVITCYREGNLLFDAINSILSQTLLPSEIIIVNDASSDRRTIEVCQELEKNALIKVVWREVNGGSSVARDNGFEVAQGDVLVPLDADDILLSNALELISKTFEMEQQIGFVYGNYLRQDKVNKEKVICPQDISLREMLKSKRFSLSSNWKLIGTTPIRKSLWQSLGGYDPSFGVNDLHDVEFWIRAIASGCRYEYIPEIIYIWRKYLGSNSRQVTPISWYRIAQKYFSIYQEIGLTYRAYELLLLGSKYLRNRSEIQYYSQEIKRCICQGNFQLSTLITLGVPTGILQFLSSELSQRR
ncbi:glycosyltransferase family 2 protein [Pseudanabaena minima]|uniref:glycosyltransferase family 2 protein n=1 Tax=Pseudanabaena minima TaxID=890415 RepID=UPI003DAA37F6